MGGLLAGLATLAQPILARVLLALGFSVVALAGVAAVVGQLRALVVTKLGGVPSDALQLAGLAGLGESLGILFGAMTFAVAYWTATKAVKIAGLSS